MSVFHHDPEIHKALSLRIFKVGRICCAPVDSPGAQGKGDLQGLVGAQACPQVPDPRTSSLTPATSEFPWHPQATQGVCRCDSGLGVRTSKSTENKNLATIQSHLEQ